MSHNLCSKNAFEAFVLLYKSLHMYRALRLWLQNPIFTMRLKVTYNIDIIKLKTDYSPNAKLNLQFIYL